MKNFRSLFFGLAALVLAIGLTFSLSAFKQSKKSTTMYYYFNSDQEADITDENKWLPIDAQDVPEASCDGENLSCVISFDTEEFDDLAALLTAYPSTADLRDNDHIIAEKNPIPPGF